MYDEGIVLTAAMRVAAGQIPHRDFYFIYGPAEPYILAGLFKMFGESLIVERLFDLFIKALLLTSVYAIVLTQCRRSIALLATAITFLWLFGLNEFGLATTPISLLNLVGSFLILRVFQGRVSVRRVFAAGAISGASTLFRYDTGIALVGIHACAICIATYLGTEGLANRLRAFASTFLPYLFGFLLLTAPPAIYYISRAPLAALLHDVVIFPAKYYRLSRNLPFPPLYLKGLENLGVYLPIAIAGASIFALMKVGLPSLVGTTARREDRSPPPEWRGFLITFTLLLGVMYLKGLVRVGPVQMYLAIIPSILIVAVLYQDRSIFPVPVRIFVGCLTYLSLIPAAWSTLHELRLEQIQHSSTVQRLLVDKEDATPADEKAWCNLPSPLTVGLCFLPEEDRQKAILFLSSHTRSGQTLYSGVGHHDRIFANDNLIYFATQRMPATRWSHFDPNLQNKYEIQAEMVRELEKKAPPYILLDSEFDLVREPNDSSRSSGVMLLDSYISDKYEPSAIFGKIAVWRRRGQTPPMH